MNINLSTKLSRDSKKLWYYLEWGKGIGQRKATGIYTWTRPKTKVEKNHNKEAQAILETKRSQMVLDQHSINSSYVPQHKLKTNFLDYYSDYISKIEKLEIDT